MCQQYGASHPTELPKWRTDGVGSGLGDRFAHYALVATVAELHKTTMLTYWSNGTGNGVRPPYPQAIHEFVCFPQQLQFVSEDAYRAANHVPFWNWPNRTSVYESSAVPEAAFTALSAAGRLPDTSLATYLRVFSTICRQMHLHARYQSLLPPAPYVALHLRRTDRIQAGGSAKAAARRADADRRVQAVMDHLLATLPANRWVFLSDEKPLLGRMKERVTNSSRHVLLPSPYYPEPFASVQPLLDYFSLVDASTIVQSVPGAAGWSSFSYTASRMGGSVLLACVPPATKFQAIEEYLHRNDQKLRRVKLLDGPPPRFGTDRLDICSAVNDDELTIKGTNRTCLRLKLAPVLIKGIH